MRFKSLVIACFMLLTPSASAQTGTQTTDPVSGNWGADGLTFLELKYDGKSSVSGTTIWRDGTRYEHRAPIETGTFDSKTGALKLEGKGTMPDGATARYVIEGAIDNGTVTGTFKFGDRGGEFTFKKQ